MELQNVAITLLMSVFEHWSMDMIFLTQDVYEAKLQGMLYGS